MGSEWASYRTLARQHSTSLKIERSEFIAHGAFAKDTDEARAFIAAIQQKYRDATHNCWAYRTGAPGPATEYCSDAGEPSGTAGRPILSVIKANDLHNCVIVVTRYFGGRKLGVPGLIKAYTRAAEQLVEEAGISDLVVMRRVRAICDYSRLDQVDHVIRTFNAILENRVFTDKVELAVCVRASQCDLLIGSLCSLCDEVILDDAQPHLSSECPMDRA